MLAQKNFERSGGNRDYFVNRVLELILAAATAQLPDLSGNVRNINYMRAVPVETAPPNQISMVRFIGNSIGNVRALLVLEQAVGTRFDAKLVLPIHSAEKEVRPGAPTVFFQKTPVSLLSSKLVFPAGVDKSVRSEIREYLKSGIIRSSLAIPMQDGPEIVGVVNIEATSNIFDPRDGRIAEVALSLHPLCMALASLIGRDLP
jgi:hypothetical protein